MPRFTESRTRCGFYVHAVALDMVDTQHETVGVLALLSQLDEAADGHARSREAQHRMRDERGPHRRDGKAGCNRRQAKRHDEADGAPAQQHG
jgi:hypothetical protein